MTEMITARQGAKRKEEFSAGNGGASDGKTKQVQKDLHGTGL